MIDVIVVYDRSAASVIEQQAYTDNAADAFKKRLELERAYRERLDVEVVLLSAVAFDDLKISHARYFDPASISLDRQTQEIERILGRAS